jgi:hypothetical protein
MVIPSRAEQSAPSGHSSHTESPVSEKV